MTKQLQPPPKPATRPQLVPAPQRSGPAITPPAPHPPDADLPTVPAEVADAVSRPRPDRAHPIEEIETGLAALGQAAKAYARMGLSAHVLERVRQAVEVGESLHETDRLTAEYRRTVQ